MKIGTFTHNQLTAPGNGTVAKHKDVGSKGGLEKITVATIDTSVVVRRDYCNSAAFSSGVVQGVEHTITANGTYAFPVLPGFAYSRPVFVSEAGGTAATVDVVTEIHE